jgi:hypothetical protein
VGKCHEVVTAELCRDEVTKGVVAKQKSHLVEENLAFCFFLSLASGIVCCYTDAKTVGYYDKAAMEKY